MRNLCAILAAGAVVGVCEAVRGAERTVSIGDYASWGFPPGLVKYEIRASKADQARLRGRGAGRRAHPPQGTGYWWADGPRLLYREK